MENRVGLGWVGREWGALPLTSGREIFEQQAAQGYYEDAASTGRLFQGPDGVRWSVVELARLRAENGDLPGARAMMMRFAGSDPGAQIAEAVALVQVSKAREPVETLVIDHAERPSAN